MIAVRISRPDPADDPAAGEGRQSPDYKANALLKHINQIELFVASLQVKNNGETGLWRIRCYSRRKGRGP